MLIVILFHMLIILKCCYIVNRFLLFHIFLWCKVVFLNFSSFKMLADIAFEQISENYWYATYGPFRVIMMKDSGYINATKLYTSGGKNYFKWSHLKSSQELMEVVTQKLNDTKVLENIQPTLPNTLGDGNHQKRRLPSPPCKIIQTMNQTEVECIISGTYCHPLLIPHIGSWISAEFAIMVSEVVNTYITCQYKENIHNMEMQFTVAEQQHQMYKEEAIQQTQQLEKVVKRKKLQLDTWGNSHAFTMVRLNNLNDAYPYYAIRCKRLGMSGAVKKLQVRNPNSILIYQNTKVPNPINLYNRLKACGFLQFKRNYCKSLVGEADLIKKLGDLHAVVE